MTIIDFQGGATRPPMTEAAKGVILFGYALTAFAACGREAEKATQSRKMVYNPMVWAWVFQFVGIYRILQAWQGGILTKVRAPVVEADALAHLEREAALWVSTNGRTHLTAFEDRVMRLEREYMTKCQTREFRVKYGVHAAHTYEMHWSPTPREEAFNENTIDDRKCHAWIAARMTTRTQGVLPHEVKWALGRVTNVLLLRDALGLDVMHVPVETAQAFDAAT